MKILNLLKQNIFLFFSLFLIIFIPLYPKIPLIGLTHVNVYIRAEDFIVSVVVLFYVIQLIRKKQSLKTPLTLAIIAFWISGFISTLLGVLFIFPHLNDPTITGNPSIYSRNALLFYARHIEYMSLFFIAYAGIKNKKNIKIVIPAIVLTLLLVVLYGYGQRFIPQRFPAFSTMNEEFAKGIPLVLDAAGRLQSTFAGHYDFGAYLVMIIPLIGSLIFGYRNWFVRIGLLSLGFLSFVALLMTQSRTSFVMYLMAVIFMLILQKQKKWILPVIIISFVLLKTFTGLYGRYAATFSSVNRIVDARTGKVIGYGDNINGQIVVDNVQPSGPGLYAGSLSTEGKKIGSASNITIKTQKGNSKSIDVQNLQGDFVIQKASALDASLTTRLQAEWPNAIKALKRNLLFGSGYSSITLATDGNYFRFLGETGFAGFGLFGLIFLIYSIYVAKTLKDVDDKLTRSFVLGVSAGIFGLALNAVLIDVFESSKIAYTLWLFVGITLGTLELYRKKAINIITELKNVLISTPAILIYFSVLSLILFAPMLYNFFVADDFTWLKWVSGCDQLLKSGIASCDSKVGVIAHFLTRSDNFFYRPGMMAFFYFLQNAPFGGISPAAYHLASLGLHSANTILVFLIVKQLFNKKLFASLAAVIFLTLSSHGEAIFWISAVGHLFASFFALSAVWLFMQWRNDKKLYLLVASVISSFLAPLFHEYGVIAPVLVVALGFVVSRYSKHSFSKYYALLYAMPLFVYFVLKYISNSWWSAGDYKYNLIKLPFNAIGNIFGTVGYIFAGTPFLSINDAVRSYARENLLISAFLILILLSIIFILYKKFVKKLKRDDIYIIAVSLIFFLIPLLPFLGLGNIAPRYTYLASVGAIILAVYIAEKLSNPLSRLGDNFNQHLMIIFTVFFVAFQFGQVKIENSNWQKAGQITNNFLQYMNDGYEDLGFGTIKDPIFYYVNVPQRYNTAWVFPTGVQDATWFTYKERNLTTRTTLSLSEAKLQAAGIANARIFVFDNKGNITLLKN
jgi:hypothetical protein